MCKDGSYNLDANNPEGCTLCECDTRGSYNTSCDRQSGQCYCKPNVMGKRCDTCREGYYALDENDFDQNGCSHACNCNPDGTPPGVSSCESIGGNCECKKHVTGRSCDTCIEGTYGFDPSEENGCKVCDCDVRGTDVSAGQCDPKTGQCTCKKNVESQKCDTCKANTFGLSEDNPDGCGPCDCYPPGMIKGERCSAEEGKCPCIKDAGDPSKTNYTCVCICL